MAFGCSLIGIGGGTGRGVNVGVVVGRADPCISGQLLPNEVIFGLAGDGGQIASQALEGTALGSSLRRSPRDWSRDHFVIVIDATNGQRHGVTEREGDGARRGVRIVAAVAVFHRTQRRLIL